MSSGYHEPLYRLVFVGLAATALALLVVAGIDGGTERHDARLVSSTTVVPGVALVVEQPAPGAHLTEPTVTLRGTADPGATIAVGAATTVAGADRAWTLTVDLPVGASPVTVRATLAGRPDSTITMTLHRDGAQVMTTTTTTRNRRRSTTTAAPPSAPASTTTTVLEPATTTTSVELPSTSTTEPAPATTTSTEAPPATTSTTGG